MKYHASAMNDLGRRILVLLASIQQSIVPFFVNPFRDGAQPLRAQQPSQLEPAGYAFSIWGPIYLLAIAYGIWQLTRAGRSDAATARIAPLATALYLSSSIWLCAAKYGPLWLTPVILAIMAMCAAWSLCLSVAGTPRAGAAWWCGVLPFAVYAGWTLCATFVNIAEVAPGYGFDRFGLSAAGYALLSLGVVTALAGVLLWLTKASLPLAATILWALAAIAVAAATRGHDARVIVGALVAGAAVIALSSAIRLSSRNAS
jgi:hypothetical protein